MGLRVSETSGYYGGEAPSLFWEMTVSECLSDPESPYQRALERPRTYGAILARWLARRIGLDCSWRLVEIGGGYGKLMTSFVEVVPVEDLTMVDISPFFGSHQRRRLGGRPGSRFVTADVFEYLDRCTDPADLVIANENLGDLPTAVDIRKTELLSALAGGRARELHARVADLVARLGISVADAPEVFHFNLGAVELIERLRPVARAVFLAEHGSDTVLPEPYRFLPIPPGDGYPRKIALRGHDEYTTRFAHLEQAATALGYRVRRFHMADLLGVRRDPALQRLALQELTYSEETEAVHEFCTHVSEYQCMLLTRGQDAFPPDPAPRRGPG